MLAQPYSLTEVRSVDEEVDVEYDGRQNHFPRHDDESSTTELRAAFPWVCAEGHLQLVRGEAC